MRCPRCNAPIVTGLVTDPDGREYEKEFNPTREEAYLVEGIPGVPAQIVKVMVYKWHYPTCAGRPPQPGATRAVQMTGIEEAGDQNDHAAAEGLQADETITTYDPEGLDREASES